jgi:hypothetical protein
MFQRALNGFMNQTLQKLLDGHGKLLGGIGGTSSHCMCVIPSCYVSLCL